MLASFLSIYISYNFFAVQYSKSQAATSNDIADGICQNVKGVVSSRMIPATLKRIEIGINIRKNPINVLTI